MTQEQAFQQGFVDKCAAHGVDPVLVIDAHLKKEAGLKDLGQDLVGKLFGRSVPESVGRYIDAVLGGKKTGLGHKISLTDMNMRNARSQADNITRNSALNGPAIEKDLERYEDMYNAMKTQKGRLESDLFDETRRVADARTGTAAGAGVGGLLASLLGNKDDE